MSRRGLQGAGEWTRQVRNLWPVVVLLLTLWAVRYLRSSEFGFYEDDLTHIPTAVQMTPREWLRFTGEIASDLRRQGTPLKLPISYGLANLGWGLGGLQGLYVVGFAVLALNVVLFYGLARGLSCEGYALCAGLAYVLYSADTTQAFLTHSFVIQPSITALLLALVLYQRRLEFPAYLIIVVSLLTYETTFPVFVGAPLLMGPWDRAWRRRSLRHVLVCGFILAAVVLARAAVGEGRLGNLTFGNAILVPIQHMLIGPAVALATYAYRPLQAIQALRADVLLVFLLSATIIGLLLWNVRPTFSPPPPASDLHLARSGSAWRRGVNRWVARWARLPPEVQAMVRLSLAGLVLLVLAYSLTFTVRPYAISGRDTRVHAAGVVGSSVLVGSVLFLAVMMAERQRRKSWVVPALAACLGLLAGYGMVIQDDYSLAWSLQRHFWTQLVRVIPDVGDGSVILVDPSGLRDPRQIGANYWNLPRVLRQLYQFPSTWETEPKVVRLVEGWEERIVDTEGRLRLDAATIFAPASDFGRVEPAKSIYIRVRDGELERMSGPFPPGIGRIELPRAPDPGEPAFPRDFLYGILVLPQEGAP